LLKREQKREADRLRKRKARANQIKKTPARVPTYIANMVADLKGMPDLSDGACQTQAGRVAHDLVWRDEDSKLGGRSMNIAAAKSICGLCDVEDLCLAWAVKGERWPGEWGGVYGGLTPDERAKLGRKAA
jgi:hypothetical protein